MLSLVFLFLTTLEFTAVAQKITYLYDSAGNRVSRAYVINVPRPVVKKMVPTDTTEVKLTEKMSIEVYPNPTKGALHVDINGLKEFSTLEFRLFNPNGQLLQTSSGTMGSNQLDLSEYNQGWYLLKVITDQKTVNFKVIKE